MDGTTPHEKDVVVRPPWDTGPVLIGGTNVYLACGIMGSLEILNKHGSTGSMEIGDTQNFGTSIDENLAEDGDSTTISSKAIGR